MFLKLKRSLKSSQFAHEKPTWPDLWILSAVERSEFFSKISRPPNGKEHDKMLYIGLPPLPVIVGNEGLGWDSLQQKLFIILVVTVTVRGPHPIYICICICICIWVCAIYLVRWDLLGIFPGAAQLKYILYIFHAYTYIYIYIHVCWHWKYYYIYKNTYIHLLQVSLLKTRENGLLSSDTLRSTSF